MNRLPIICSGLALLLSSCSPRPVFRMQPQAEQTTFDQGVEYVQVEQNGVVLTMSYYRHFSDQFVMDVEIVNETDSLLRIDPTMFSYDALKNEAKDQPVGKKGPVIASRSAMDPEQELLKTDMKLSEEEAEQRTSDILHAIGQTASLASSIAADTPEEREALRRDRTEDRVEHALRQQDHELEKAELRDQRAVWEIDALRKTDLFPGEYVRGYIFFEHEPDAEKYSIQFDHEQVSFNLIYLQWKYEKGEIVMDE